MQTSRTRTATRTATRTGTPTFSLRSTNTGSLGSTFNGNATVTRPGGAMRSPSTTGGCWGCCRHERVVLLEASDGRRHSAVPHARGARGPYASTDCRTQAGFGFARTAARQQRSCRRVASVSRCNNALGDQVPTYHLRGATVTTPTWTIFASNLPRTHSSQSSCTAEASPGRQQIMKPTRARLLQAAPVWSRAPQHPYIVTHAPKPG